ncbi:MAG: hypothetical protein SF029_19730, partial [bacterium]|nr:hypothetical protein [bacterium]
RAQQLAHDVADHYQQPFPAPFEIKALDAQPDYYFGYGTGPNHAPSLEAVKTWMDGAERRFDTFTIAEYASWEDAAPDEVALEAVLKSEGLEAAMNQAERMAVASGYLDPDRVDPRVFFDETAPPDPFVTEHTRDMRHQPAYHIDAITAEGDARLEVTKSWGEGDHQRLVIPQSDWLTARENAEVAHDLMERGDLQGAMILVEIAGIEAGVIDPKRDDPRLFTDGPPDPFTTIRERDLASPEMDTQTLPAYPTLYADWAEQVQQEREANAHLEGTAWFEATFKKGERDLLQPLDDTVNYGVVVQAVDPWTSELAVEKYWKEPNGHLGSDSQTIQTFASEDDVQREAAEAAREGLLDVYDARGLEAMMHQAELLAMDSGQLDGERLDPRLFTNGPPDRFETLAQQLEVEPNPYWNTDREQIEARSGQDVENPYWRLETLPVNDLDGQPLGHALHMVVYPGIPQEADAVGSPAISPDEPFRLLEMAHFETTEAADMFGKEFNSYLIPDVLDGPELAVEVARLEGLPAEWKTLEGDELKAYQNADLTLIREPADWHLYNPNAERDARIAAEGLYTDPMVSSVDLNRTDDSASTEPAPFELDL